METATFQFLFFVSVLFCFVYSVSGDPAASGVIVERDIAYKVGDDLSAYESERCKLDLYLPANASGCPVVVWFHGGGMTGGDKSTDEAQRVAHSLAAQGVMVAVVNYRLSPKATYPAYLQDGAAAFAWMRKYAGEYGGDSGRCYIGGHSAGGYLAWMLGLDSTWLGEQKLETGDVAGLIPISGQTIVHSTVRQERGIPRSQIVIDAAAPLHHAGKIPFPVLCICAAGDNPMRCQENDLLCAALVHAGSATVDFLVVEGRNHMSIIMDMPNDGDPVTAVIVEFVGE